MDTTELVTASASAGVGHEVGAAMAGANNIEVGVAQSIAGDLTSSLIRGRADPEMILGGALGTMGGLYLGNKIQQIPFFAEGAANNRARAQANEYSAVKQIVAVTAGSSRMIGLNSEDVNQDGNVSSDNQSQSSGAKVDDSGNGSQSKTAPSMPTPTSRSKVSFFGGLMADIAEGSAALMEGFHRAGEDLSSSYEKTKAKLMENVSEATEAIHEIRDVVASDPLSEDVRFLEARATLLSRQTNYMLDSVEKYSSGIRFWSGAPIKAAGILGPAIEAFKTSYEIVEATTAVESIKAGVVGSAGMAGMSGGGYAAVRALKFFGAGEGEGLAAEAALGGAAFATGVGEAVVIGAAAYGMSQLFQVGAKAIWNEAGDLINREFRS